MRGEFDATRITSGGAETRVESIKSAHQKAIKIFAGKREEERIR